MERLYVRNKFFTLRGNSEVVDDNKEPHYVVKGKLISPTHKKFVYDMNGNHLFTVRNKYWHFFVKSAFVYDSNGEKICRVKRKFWAIKQRFIVEGYKDEIEVGGSWTTFNMSFIKNGAEVGKVCREFNLFKDCFRVEAEHDEMPFAIALTIAIDNIIDNERRS